MSQFFQSFWPVSDQIFFIVLNALIIFEYVAQVQIQIQRGQTVSMFTSFALMANLPNLPRIGLKMHSRSDVTSSSA
jgi:hypothetical protein